MRGLGGVLLDILLQDAFFAGLDEEDEHRPDDAEDQHSRLISHTAGTQGSHTDKGGEPEDFEDDLIAVGVGDRLLNDKLIGGINARVAGVEITETHILFKAKESLGLARLGLLDVVVQDGVAHIG